MEQLTKNQQHETHRTIAAKKEPKNILSDKISFMTKIFLFTFSLLLSINSISQMKNTKGSIGISIPVIWNNSEATFYRLGSPNYPKGNAISYGLNINYTQPFYKGVYGKVGVGYFKQRFGIVRPFNYDSPIQLGWSTKAYNYHNAQLYGGIGYKKGVSKTTLINGNITYNQYYSFRQKYINASSVSSQIDHKNITIGRMISIDMGAERKFSKHISAALDIVFPAFTQWKKDEIFFYTYRSNDEQQIARNRFSAGISFSCYYHF